MSNNKKIEEIIQNWKSELKTYLEDTELFEETDFRDYSSYFDSEPRKNPVLFMLTTEGTLWEGLNYGVSNIVNTFDEYINKQDYYYEIHSSCLLTFYLRNNRESEPYYKHFFNKWLEQNSETLQTYNDKITRLKTLAKETMEFLKNNSNRDLNNRIIVELSGSNMILNEFYLKLSETENMAAIIKINKYSKTDQYGQSGSNLPRTPTKFKDNEIIITRKKKIDNSYWYSFNEQSMTEWDGKSLNFNFLD